MNQLLGEVVEKDGMLCLQTGPRTWYPLNGNSGVASEFIQAFGMPVPADKGKRVYISDDFQLSMENTEQRDVRQAMENPPRFSGGNILDMERYRK
jgi:hypothetical protein